MKLFNTKSRQLENFQPITDEEVLIYTCGPTVYDFLHIGNWVAYIRWDILVRTLSASNYKVKRIMNITDVGHLVSDADEGEDKMEKGARREGKTAWQIAEFYTDNFKQGIKDLNLIEPDVLAKATDYIADQIALISVLETKGLSYKTSDGVYFDTAKFPKYSAFAKLNLEEQQEGSRVEVNQEKRNPWDFALWKFSPTNQKRDMEWDSPWGKGFPGWHLECSAIAMKLLGESLDIHTGGIDHIPVHHTNEIAQSEAATGKTFSNFWLHNNFLLVDGVKISKSLQNGITLADITAKGYSPMDFKMFILQSHYRSETNFTWEGLKAAKNRLQNMLAMSDLQFQSDDQAECLGAEFWSNSPNTLLQHLQNDLDTPMALASLSEQIDQIMSKAKINNSELGDFKAYLATVDDLLGLKIASRYDLNEKQRQLLAERQKARDKKNWQQSDTLRDQLKVLGILINDTALGQVWYRN